MNNLLFFIFKFILSFRYLTWENAFRNLIRIQRRLYKCAVVGDLLKALIFQKTIINSNSIRLFSIREITQFDSRRKISGVDGKVCLSFTERFELNEFLKKNVNNWNPLKLRKVYLIRKNGSSFFLFIPSISDRVWQCLVKFSLEPMHEASFSFRNYGFRNSSSVLDCQRLVLLNLNQDSFGIQKRVLFFNLKTCFKYFNYKYLLRSLLVPRGIKLGIFRLLRKGFIPEFTNDLMPNSNLSSLLANILLNGIEFSHSCIRYGYEVIYFLKPFDNEILIFKKVRSFLGLVGFNLVFESCLFSICSGFTFLDWNFSILKNHQIVCVPSFNNYQVFLRRIKAIVNNSNYGAEIKSAKIYPIVREWRNYNRFATSFSNRYSLFFIKKRAFKIFNSESRQDSYSTKKLINKCFNTKIINSFSNKTKILNFFSSGHISFCIDYTILNFKEYLSFEKNFSFFRCFFCFCVLFLFIYFYL